MPKLRAMSSASSQGDIRTPKRKKSRGSRSLCSPASSTASGRLPSLVDQFKEKNMESFALSPLNGRSVLTDNTDIQEPKRKSWWKNLNENSQEILEVLQDNKVTEANDIIEEFDIEVLSQEKKNFTLDLPETSDDESINSIVLPQRKLFTQKENQPQKKFGQLGGNRETLAKLHKTNTTNVDKTVNVGTRELFQNKRSKPVFPAALLNMSRDETAVDKTKENLLADPKPQVRNIFGNRPATKRKNMFADFIVSESEDEISEIQPKVFGFQKKVEQRRASSISKGRDRSPTSSVTTDMEMDDWRLLPSSTMVENQLEEMVAGHTPVKRARLSKLSEAKESEAGTNTIQSNSTNKTKESNKSVTSKNKSRNSPPKEILDTSRTTRSMTKNTSQYEEINTSTKKSDTKVNKSQNKTANKDNKLEVSNAEKSQKLNRSRTRNSSKIMENEIVTDETNAANAINNATRVINKSTSKKLSNSQVTNKSLKKINKESDDNEEINIETQNISNEQVIEDDDENNLTLEYDGDEMEEAVVQNQQKSQKENIANQNNSIKNTTKADTNKSKTQAKQINETLNQKQTQSKTVEESVESQQSTQDNVDGNLEHEPDSEQNENILDDSKQNRQSIEEANESQTDNANEEIENKVNASANEDEENVQEKSDDSHINQEANVSQNDNIQVDEAQDQEQDDEEVNESQEIEDENNVSHENEAESQEVEADESQVIEEEEDNHESNQEEDNEANESQEQDESRIERNAESDEEQEVNESQVIEKENESQDEGNQTVEAVESEEKAAESEEEAAESEAEAAESEVEAAESEAEEESEQEAAASEVEAAESEEEKEESEEEGVESDAGEEDSDESMHADNNESEQIEEANQSQEVNESQEIANEEENEEENESANDGQVDDDEASDESDRAIASDPEISDDDDQEEMEVDDENDQASNEAVAESEPNESEPLEGNAGQSTEEIEESPNVTHDTTGRHRKKQLNKSPEAILHDKTNQMDSFTVKGRNTSVRKTKSMIKDLDIRPSLAPRDSIGSDGTRNSTAEGSGWDSHRTTRKTLRQTFGKDFTPRKSLRAMVMEKSAKRQTKMDTHHVAANLSPIATPFPQANSTELPDDSNRHVEEFEVSDHEISKRTRQTTLELYLQKMKQQNIEKKLKMEEAVRNSLKAPVRDTLSLFKVPSKPAPRRPKPSQTKSKKQIESVIPLDELPAEVIEDMKYKPPKRFRPANASWITKRLYKFLENKLEPNYDYKARVRAEKLVETIYHFAKDLRRHDVAPTDAVDVLKHELARLQVVNTHFEFYEFFHEFMPREVRVKVVPDIVNNIPLPRHGVFSAILRGNTVQG